MGTPSDLSLSVYCVALDEDVHKEDWKITKLLPIHLSFPTSSSIHESSSAAESKRATTDFLYHDY